MASPDIVLDAREHPLYHCVTLSPKETYIVAIYQTDDGKLSQVWKRYDPSTHLKEEEYVVSKDRVRSVVDCEPCHYLHAKAKVDVTPTSAKTCNLSRYQHFIKLKTEVLSSSHPHLTKKERYNIALEEWRKAK